MRLYPPARSPSAYPPELTAFLNILGIDVNKSPLPCRDLSDLSHNAPECFRTSTGCALGFFGAGEICVLRTFQ